MRRGSGVMVLDRSPTPFCTCRFFSHLRGTEDSVIRPVSRVHRLPPSTRPRTPLRRVTDRRFEDGYRTPQNTANAVDLADFRTGVGDPYDALRKAFFRGPRRRTRRRSNAVFGVGGGT